MVLWLITQVMNHITNEVKKLRSGGVAFERAVISE